MWFFLQAWNNYTPNADPVCSCMPDIWYAKKKKPFDLQISSWMGKKKGKIAVNSKYYCEHQCTCNTVTQTALE